jgi:integrase
VEGRQGVGGSEGQGRLTEQGDGAAGWRGVHRKGEVGRHPHSRRCSLQAERHPHLRGRSRAVHLSGARPRAIVRRHRKRPHLEDRPLWATAFYAGLRRGELRGLRDEDVDLEANEIHVRRGWDDVDGEIDPKSAKGTRTRAGRGRAPLVPARASGHGPAAAEPSCSSARPGSDRSVRRTFAGARYARGRSGTSAGATSTRRPRRSSTRPASRCALSTRSVG